MKREARRVRRRERALVLFSGGDLFLAGILIMPAFLFNPSLVLRTLQFLLFWLYAFLAGRKNSTLATLLVGAAIVLFNLLVPYGKVLAELGPLRITAGALLSGLQKAVTLEGLIMLSKATIRSDLRLPGRFGSLIGESFRIFDRIMERKGKIDWRDPIAGIDALLMELSEEGAAPSVAADAARRPRSTLRSGRAVLALAVILAWAPLGLLAAL